MIQISNAIEINRPVSHVFEYIADVNNNPKWMPVTGVQPISQGSVTNGYKFKQQFYMMGRTYNLDGVITHFDPGTKIAFSYDSSVFTWRGEYDFQPSATGTLVSAQGKVHLTGSLKMMEPMFAPKIRKLIHDTAPNLKKILES